MRSQLFRVILLIATVLAVVVVLPVRASASPAVYQAIVAAGIIAGIYMVLALAGFEFGLDKTHKVFMTTVFGGMGVRLVLTLITLTILLVDGYHPLALALSLMFFYTIALVIEVTYAVRVLARRKVTAQDVERDADELLVLPTPSLQHVRN